MKSSVELWMELTKNQEKLAKAYAKCLEEEINKNMEDWGFEGVEFKFKDIDPDDSVFFVEDDVSARNKKYV